MSAIEVLSRVSETDFLAASSNLERPVLIKGGIRDWKAINSWTVEALRERFGFNVVTVGRSADGVFRGDPKLGFSHLVEPMQFDSFLDLLTGKVKSSSKYYLAQLPFGGEFQSLFEDVSRPTLLGNATLRAVNLWFGPGDTTSPLHFDRADNLLCQVMGEKRLLLFSPEDSVNLYPHPDTSKTPHMSQLNLKQVDFDRFPKFKLASASEVLIAKGDMLFIPVHWWHEVYSLSLSISVNFWYAPSSPEPRNSSYR